MTFTLFFPPILCGALSGAVAGIAVGVIIIVALVTVLVYYGTHQRRQAPDITPKRPPQDQPEQQAPFSAIPLAVSAPSAVPQGESWLPQPQPLPSYGNVFADETSVSDVPESVSEASSYWKSSYD